MPYGEQVHGMSEAIETVLAYVGEMSAVKAAKLKPTHLTVVRAGRSAATKKKEKPAPLRAPEISVAAVGRLAERLNVLDLVILEVSDISERTFQRRKVDHKPLSASESDRVLRIARVAERAESVFASPDKARRWLSSPHSLLGRAPLELLGTDAGARAVEDELVRIDFGDFA